ncbi:MAG: hypothetical protein QOI24_4098 [Acidobacteriota bacterium]|jgi:hypothetical protein|nr:hypothetical protein [Acidobacteriota bacterium]
MVRLIVTVALLSLFAPIAAAARQRTASHASDCTLTIAPRAVSVPAAGGAYTIVVGRSGPCKWTPEPGADWVTINTISISDGVITFTVSPNADATPRATMIDIVGAKVAVTQEAADPNLLTNGKFDSNINGWSTLFSTGSGDASWSTLDAHGSAVSGSALVRSTQGSLGYQLLQCVNVLPNRAYEYGLTSRIAHGQDSAGRVILGVYEYDVADCNKVGYNYYATSNLNPPLDTWTPYSSTFTTSDTAKSLYFVVAAGFHRTPPFTINFDDAFVRPRK